MVTTLRAPFDLSEIRAESCTTPLVHDYEYHQLRRVHITGPALVGFPVICCKHQMYAITRRHTIEGRMFWSEPVENTPKD